ncbi:lipopolysaccharide biosynthesis protein [Segetibacter aerophilus]|uniref:O-antigen export protein n=1 Tax=Segetibacter aerophilus TaxID=670293 RepID=A0A512BGZ0_9BACT|nr:MATE family efflux transporter [Segetibacter aerophilus]GEO11234.1 O-antigen export protein [Segetibacter aerophilus]
MHKLLGTKNARSLLIRKNIIFSILIKGGSVLITLLLLPLTINYINPQQYGIWLTISGIVYWINIFDVGLGNGLKNEIGYALAVKDESKIKAYVSTAYALLFIIASALFIILSFICSFFNWNKILNISDNIDYSIYKITVLVLAFFCLQFFLQLINAVLSATQQVFKSSIILLWGQIIAITAIYILTLTVPPKLIILVFVLSGAPTLALTIASVYLYYTELKRFAPSVRLINFKYSKNLLNIGSSFFLIQLGAMALIHANNFIIARILGPQAVTIYNIPFRFFSILSMSFAIIMMPYWSAFTDAFASNDLNWIKESIKKIRLVWLFLSLTGILIYFFSNRIYKIWINDSIKVPASLSFSMLVYMIVYMWHTLHVYFLNGIGKIRLQLFVVLVGVLANIPLVIYLGKQFGLPGIVCGNSLTFGVMGLIYTVQYEKIISGKASGVWCK